MSPAGFSRASVRAVLATVCFVLSACERTSTNGDPPHEPSAKLDPAGPEVGGWEESRIYGVACRHPPVVANCEKGWCRIPAGCFIMGSPDTELWRGEYSERETAVTLSRSFEIGQFEVTRRQWSEVVTTIPDKPPKLVDIVTCTDPECPVRYLTWFEALQFANLLSTFGSPRAVKHEWAPTSCARADLDTPCQTIVTMGFAWRARCVESDDRSRSNPL